MSKLVYTRRSVGLAAASAVGGLVTGGAAAPAPSRAVGSYLATSGGTIVDAATGKPFIIKGIHWYGMEINLIPIMLGWRDGADRPGRAWRTMTYTGPAQNGLQPNTVHEGVLDQMVRLGFNTVRLSICEDVTWPNAQVRGAAGTPSAGKISIGGLLNPDLLTGAQTLSSNNYDYIPALAVLDKMVAYAGSIGLRVILDMHCLEPSMDNTAHKGLWYTTAHPGDKGTGPTSGSIGTQGDVRNEQQWLDAWAFLAKHYANTPAVCAFDLMNEPYTITWDNNPLRGWPAACERAAAVIQAVNPNVLLVCEGGFNAISGRNGKEYTSWGEDLTGVRARPIVTPVPNRVVYSPHDYPNPSQARFKAGFPATLAPFWDSAWGYIAKDGIAPILIGEFSGDFRDPVTLSDVVQNGKPYSAKASATRDAAWMKSLSDYICSNGLSWAYFCFNIDLGHAVTDTDILLDPLQKDGITPIPRTLAAMSAMLAQ